MVDRITGKTKLYRHRDMPDAIMRAASKIPKKDGNPHLPVYDSTDLENFIKAIEDELHITIPLVYAKADPKDFPYILQSTS